MARGRGVQQEWTLGGEGAPELQSGPGGSSTGGQTTVWKGRPESYKGYILNVLPPSSGTDIQPDEGQT